MRIQKVRSQIGGCGEGGYIMHTRFAGECVATRPLDSSKGKPPSPLNPNTIVGISFGVQNNVEMMKETSQKSKKNDEGLLILLDRPPPKRLNRDSKHHTTSE